MNTTMKTPEICIISGTDRPGSNALRVARYVQKLYRRQEAEAEVMDLKEFPVEAVAGGRYGEELPELDPYIDAIVEADGLVIICPEYNGGYPGILKLLIDYLPFPQALGKKPVSLIGEATGAFGAMRAVEQLQQVVGYRNALIFPERVFISRIHENFDDEKGILDPFQQELLEEQVKNFTDFVKKVGKRFSSS